MLRTITLMLGHPWQYFYLTGCVTRLCCQPTAVLVHVITIRHFVLHWPSEAQFCVCEQARLKLNLFCPCLGWLLQCNVCISFPALHVWDNVTVGSGLLQLDLICTEIPVLNNIVFKHSWWCCKLSLSSRFPSNQHMVCALHACAVQHGVHWPCCGEDDAAQRQASSDNWELSQLICYPQVTSRIRTLLNAAHLITSKHSHVCVDIHIWYCQHRIAPSGFCDVFWLSNFQMGQGWIWREDVMAASWSIEASIWFSKQSLNGSLNLWNVKRELDLIYILCWSRASCNWFQKLQYFTAHAFMPIAFKLHSLQ